MTVTVLLRDHKQFGRMVVGHLFNFECISSGADKAKHDNESLYFLLIIISSHVRWGFLR